MNNAEDRQHIARRMADMVFSLCGEYFVNPTATTIEKLVLTPMQRVNLRLEEMIRHVPFGNRPSQLAESLARLCKTVIAQRDSSARPELLEYAKDLNRQCVYQLTRLVESWCYDRQMYVVESHAARYLREKVRHIRNDPYIYDAFGWSSRRVAKTSGGSPGGLASRPPGPPRDPA